MIKNIIKIIKKNWYFIKQDIVSYLISTMLYITLCLIREFNWYSMIYGLFECLVFYFPFWFIRVRFNKTYHSSSWKFCKLCTRIMLCLGVFTLWILPIKYSLFNSIFVAFGCNFILYLIAVEVEDKKDLKIKNEELSKEFDNICEELKKYKNIDIFSMSENELRDYATSKGLTDTQIDTLILKVKRNYKWVDIMLERRYSKTAIRYHKQQIIQKLKIDL